MKNIKFGGGVIVIVITLMIGGWFFLPGGTKTTSVDEPTACTADARICPDGSAVGRVGPNCEFALCPSEIEDKEDLDNDKEVIDPVPAELEWTTYIDEEWKYSFEYPNNYTIEEKRDGFEVVLTPDDGVETVRDFFSLIVIRYPTDIGRDEELPNYLFYRANLPDGELAWLKDEKFFSLGDHILGFEGVDFGVGDNEAISVRENSVNKEFGEYRSIVYVLREPVIYRVTHDLSVEQTHGDIIKRIEDSFTVLP